MLNYIPPTPSHHAPKGGCGGGNPGEVATMEKNGDMAWGGHVMGHMPLMCMGIGIKCICWIHIGMGDTRV